MTDGIPHCLPDVPTKARRQRNARYVPPPASLSFPRPLAVTLPRASTGVERGRRRRRSPGRAGAEVGALRRLRPLPPRRRRSSCVSSREIHRVQGVEHLEESVHLHPEHSAECSGEQLRRQRRPRRPLRGGRTPSSEVLAGFSTRLSGLTSDFFVVERGRVRGTEKSLREMYTYLWGLFFCESIALGSSAPAERLSLVEWRV